MKSFMKLLPLVVSIFMLVSCGNNETGDQGSKGEKGEQSETRNSGGSTAILTGNGVPPSNLGNDGDMYIDSSSGWIYKKENNLWLLVNSNVLNEQGLEFCLSDDDTYGVGVGSAKLLSNIVIPKTYNGKLVTTIVNDGFENCSILKNIVIPSSITSIGSHAFDGCSLLTSINISNSVTSIGNYAFYNCSSLTIYCEAESKPDGWDFSWNNESPVYWGISKSYIYNNQFQYIIQNNEIMVTGSVYGATDIDIPSEIDGKRVTAIGNNSFFNCKSIVSLDISNNIVSIGNKAFSNCSSLQSINIPDSVTSIGVAAFSCCSSLQSIIISENVASIGISAFDGCSSLTIYCEAESKPVGWDPFWNPRDVPVIWDYKNK